MEAKIAKAYALIQCWKSFKTQKTSYGTLKLSMDLKIESLKSLKTHQEV